MLDTDVTGCLCVKDALAKGVEVKRGFGATTDSSYRCGSPFFFAAPAGQLEIPHLIHAVLALRRHVRASAQAAKCARKQSSVGA